ncbi:hypothetical protein WJX73_001829 [Symbiochloris irregularis]|uniref:F-box domain-containing protein n=1 Tax=Symbiochloris irregularis TaxID=706552 RepID=A0AAW1NPC1_9CHLO
MESAIAEICISELPGNALCKILSNLSFGDKIQAQRVCKLWHGVLRQPVYFAGAGERRLGRSKARRSASFCALYTTGSDQSECQHERQHRLLQVAEREGKGSARPAPDSQLHTL